MPKETEKFISAELMKSKQRLSKIIQYSYTHACSPASELESQLYFHTVFIFFNKALNQIPKAPKLELSYSASAAQDFISFL